MPLEFTIARALPSDDALLVVQDAGRVILEKSYRCILDDVFVVRDPTVIRRGQETHVFLRIVVVMCRSAFCLLPTALNRSDLAYFCYCN